MTIDQLKAAHARRAPEPTPLVFAMVLSISAGTAVSLLVAWHAYLVLTAQVHQLPFPTHPLPTLDAIKRPNLTATLTKS